MVPQSLVLLDFLLHLVILLKVSVAYGQEKIQVPPKIHLPHPRSSQKYTCHPPKNAHSTPPATISIHGNSPDSELHILLRVTMEWRSSRGLLPIFFEFWPPPLVQAFGHHDSWWPNARTGGGVQNSEKTGIRPGDWVSNVKVDNHHFCDNCHTSIVTTATHLL